MVIAEAGVNHGGELATAQKLVDAAKNSGANAVKFQLFEAHKLDPPGERQDVLRPLEFSQRQMEILSEHCKSIDIEFMCSAFDVDGIKFLAHKLKTKRIKIGSGHLANEELLHEAENCGRAVILSTGMATMEEIKAALSVIRPAVLLHCTSSYPAPMEETNLQAMVPMKKLCPAVGFSDHTDSLVLPAAAVAMGASVIEKHLTLDRNQPGPDHKASIDPEQFKRMVAHIREVEMALGNETKEPQPSEAAMMRVRDEREAFRCAI